MRTHTILKKTTVKENIMIILRQGKTKAILENSINSALTAVEHIIGQELIFEWKII